MSSNLLRNQAQPLARETGAALSPLLFGCLAAILLADSLCTAFVLPQTPGRMSEPSAALIADLPLWRFVTSLALPIPREGGAVALLLIGAAALKFAVYGLAVYLAWNRPYDRRHVAVVAVAALLCFAVAALALPNVNRDIYNYILSGRVGGVYGANPYDVPPDRFPNDPIYQYASPRYTSIPGDNKFPAWMNINVALASLGGDRPVANLLLYRGAFLLFNLANLALLGRILCRLHPRLMLAGLILYAWNPIVITHGQSKVDTIMAFFLLLAVWALVENRRKLAVVALGLSAFVKLITLPLAAAYLLSLLCSPRTSVKYSNRKEREERKGLQNAIVSTAFASFAVMLGRRSRQAQGAEPGWVRSVRAAASAALLFALTAAALYAPFWYGLDLLTIQLRLLENTRVAGLSVFHLAVYALFAGAVLWVGLSRDGRVEHLLRGWALLMLLFTLFLSRPAFSWYLITPIAVVALAAEWRFALIAIALSSVAFLMNAWDTASNETFQLPALLALSRFPTYLLIVALVALGMAALEIGRRGRQRNRAEYRLEQR